MTDHYPVAWQEGMTKGEALAAEIVYKLLKVQYKQIHC